LLNDHRRLLTASGLLNDHGRRLRHGLLKDRSGLVAVRLAGHLQIRVAIGCFIRVSISDQVEHDAGDGDRNDCD
jgi:hypothetical protein